MADGSFFAELRKRKVLQAAAIYGAVAWGVTEIIVTVVEQLFLPQWVSTLAVIGFVVGFPVAMFLSWTFDITSDGIQRADVTSRRGKASIALSMSLAAASAGVFLHAGIKFPWFVFFQKDSGLRPKDAPWNMAAAMVLFSALCILIGVFPETFYRLLPYAAAYEPYTAGKVVFYLQLLLFSGLAFFLLLPLMRRTRTLSLDIDWLWRVVLCRMAKIGHKGLASAHAALRRRLHDLLPALRLRGESHFGESAMKKRAGVFARAWSIGTTALWIAVLLTAYVLFYLI